MNVATMTIADCMAPVWAGLIAWQRDVSRPEADDCDALQRMLAARLADGMACAHAEGFDVAAVDAAAFAVAAWCDETLMCGRVGSVWEPYSLQRSHFGCRVAGAEFFVRLAQQHDPMVIEVYWICLALGFGGTHRRRRDWSTLRALNQQWYERLHGTAVLPPLAILPPQTARRNSPRLPPWLVPPLLAALVWAIAAGWMTMRFPGAWRLLA